MRTTSCWWKTKFTATSLCRHSTSPHCHHLSHELNQAKALPCQGVCVTGGTRSTLKVLDGQDLTGAHSAGHTWLEPQQATAASRAASRPPASPALARRSRTPSSGRTILICVPCCHRGNDERQARLTSSTGDDLSLEENSNIARSRLGSVATTSTLSAPHLTSKRKSINKKIFRGWALGRSTLDQQPPSFS